MLDVVPHDNRLYILSGSGQQSSRIFLISRIFLSLATKEQSKSFLVKPSMLFHGRLSSQLNFHTVFYQ